MPLKILLVVATWSEANALRGIPGIIEKSGIFSFGKHQISLLVTGVGSMAVSWSMCKWLSSNPRPDLALNTGIAGSYREDIKIGEVVIPVSDCFADAGVETRRGFITLAEAGLEDADMFPFRDGKIFADNEFISGAIRKMKPVKAITVNTASGSEVTIEKMRQKYNPDIETMEGAAFFYICCREKIPFLAMRSVSNRVEPRNKDKWDIPAALGSLSEKLPEFLIMQK